MNTREALYQDICAHPEEKSSRLAYADLLDESDKPIDQAQAEFIRLQIQISNLPEGKQCLMPVPDIDKRNVSRGATIINVNTTKLKACGHCSTCKLVIREIELLEQYTHEWNKCPCRNCEGTGKVTNEETRELGRLEICPVCDGSTDLLQVRMDEEEKTPGSILQIQQAANSILGNRVVLCERGFIDAVRCTTEELGTDKPSEWAKELVRRFPITRFAISDKQPSSDRVSSESPILVGGTSSFDWWEAGEDEDTPVRERSYYDVISKPLFQYLWDATPEKQRRQSSTKTRWVEYPNARNAILILWICAGMWIRDAVYPKSDG